VYRDTSLTTARLVAAPWKTQQKIAVSGGDSIVYERGGSNNTTGVGNYDIESYTFYPDGTGFAIDGFNSRHDLYDWKFTDATHSKLTFYIHATSSSTSVSHFYTWDNLRMKDGKLYMDVYFKDEYVHTYFHGQAIRFQENTQ